MSHQEEEKKEIEAMKMVGLNNANIIFSSKV